MVMQVQFGDTLYTGFESIQATKDIESLCGDYTIKCTTIEGGVFPAQRMQKCIVYIDQTPINTGYIDKIQGDYSASETNLQHNIIITGRDKTQDIVDSTLDSHTE